MRAIQYGEYGDSGVLQWVEIDQPEPGPGEICIRVQATAVNPFDVKARSGVFAGGKDLARPVVPGYEAAGIVDALGSGVSGIAIGDAVFGKGRATYAEYAVLTQWARQPDNSTPEQCAGLASAAQTALRALRITDVAAGGVLLVHGAAGGIGQALVQLATHRGVHVVGTASPRNHELLSDLGAVPVAYGADLIPGVRAVADRVDAVVDLAGRQIDELIDLAGDPHRVLSLVDFSGKTGIRTSSGGGETAADLELVAGLLAQGRYSVRIAAAFELSDAAAAHDLSATGHATGKIVLTVA